MRINNNLMAMNTLRQYSVNTSNSAASTERLSSGYRINRAGDDAAGLAISEKMRAQIRGLNMASKNSQDAISLVQTAEGALNETHSILQRMRELATQASSDTNDSEVVDRKALDEEFQALKKEIDDIAGKTKFNGKKLLDGSLGAATTVGSTSDIKVGGGGVTSITASGFKGTQAGKDHTINVKFVASGAAAGKYTFSYTDDDGIKTDIEVSADFANNQVFDLDFGQGRKVSIKVDAGVPTIDDEAGGFGDGDDTVTAPGSLLGGAAVVENTAGVDLIINVKGVAATIQTGANTGDELDIGINDMSASALDLDNYSSEVDTETSVGTGKVQLLTQDEASAAITSVNNAINTVSTERSKMGAYQNRLQHKINNLDTSSENLSAAESRIRDLDMAKEMTTHTKNNIMMQAATAMLAQANSAPQGVLQLLQ